MYIKWLKIVTCFNVRPHISVGSLRIVSYRYNGPWMPCGDFCILSKVVPSWSDELRITTKSWMLPYNEIKEDMSDLRGQAEKTIFVIFIVVLYFIYIVLSSGKCALYLLLIKAKWKNFRLCKSACAVYG